MPSKEERTRPHHKTREDMTDAPRTRDLRARKANPGQTPARMPEVTCCCCVSGCRPQPDESEAGDDRVHDSIHDVLERDLPRKSPPDRIRERAERVTEQRG